MSYDLMVFEGSRAPKDKEDFLAWYSQQTQWVDGLPYNDPAVCSPNLRDFYQELTQSFPRMDVDNETFEAMEEAGTDNRLTDYSISADIIYAAFAWSVAGEAYDMMRNLALKH